MHFKELLKNTLPEKDIELIPRAFEVVGDIAIIEPDDAQKYAKDIANALLQAQKNVHIVLLKTGDVKGKYRIPKYKVLAHKERDFSNVPKWASKLQTLTETIHTESGCRLKLDLAKTYFSGKLSGERARITELAKDRENILIMFAGAGPFPIVIAKKRDVKITAVEINPDAVIMLKDNVKINRVEDRITILEGDVAKTVPLLEEKFNRIVMPAPKDAPAFLGLALSKIKAGGTIHLYSFAGEEETDCLKKKVLKECKAAGKKCKILLARRCGNIGVRQYRIVIDILVK
ncbi:MAG: class I SAM-dependent methyltransferase family protein [Candidatus Aenigmarchaeota archaeon]|nr:class I SAM-dependent methyltransferase family protein [Candidatus Aenigmarchaeota archaeon]